MCNRIYLWLRTLSNHLTEPLKGALRPKDHLSTYRFSGEVHTRTSAEAAWTLFISTTWHKYDWTPSACWCLPWVRIMHEIDPKPMTLTPVVPKGHIKANSTDNMQINSHLYWWVPMTVRPFIQHWEIQKAKKKGHTPSNSNWSNWSRLHVEHYSLQVMTSDLKTLVVSMWANRL